MSKKVALLIGVSDYGEGIPSLSAPLNDVEAMKRVLENEEMGGFQDIKTLINPDPVAMQKAIQQVFQHCRQDDLVLLFFSGHGITDDNNRLYFATKGTSKDFYKAISVPASFVQDISLECYAKRQVIVLDCCYSGAFAEGWQAKSIGLNLEKELGKEGRVVLTSSTATQTSFQQEGEDLSLYTRYFVEGIETGAADKNSTGEIFVHQIHDYAKAKVQEAKPKQKPDIIIDQEGYNILLSQAPINDPETDFRKLVEKYATGGEITIAGKYILQVKRENLDITNERADEIIKEVLAPYRKHLENIRLYQKAFTEAVEKCYPLTERLINDLHALQDVLGLEDKDIANIQEKIQAEKELEHQRQLKAQRQQKQKKQPQPQPTEDTEESFNDKEFTFETLKVNSHGKEIEGETQSARYFTEDLGNEIKLEMIAIPAGEFMMGSEEYEDEQPIHRVQLEEFWLGKYPITQAQYQAVMGENPSDFKGVNNPVEQVSWNDAQDFCKRLSAKTGKQYKLPSEAQWEYACRAGNRGKWCFGDNEFKLQEYAWYEENSNSQTHPVGEKKPNDWGLFDMHGNVWEWCEDDWHDNYKNAPNDGSAWKSSSSKYVVFRGGSFGIFPDGCRSAYRLISGARDLILHDDGFRVVCVLPRTY